MFTTTFSGHNKILGAMLTGGYGPGSRYEKVEDHWSTGLISRVHTDWINVRAKRSASESKNEV